MQDDGLLEPESKVYNFLSRPTLAIICQKEKDVREHGIMWTIVLTILIQREVVHEPTHSQTKSNPMNIK